MGKSFALGLDYGTNSVRSLIVDVENGKEVSTAVWKYRHGEAGILLDTSNPDLARQHPGDYLEGLIKCVGDSVQNAAQYEGFSVDRVIGIGIDTTGSTPIPVDRDGTPLARAEALADNLNAQAWLWKDHTSHEEATEITKLAAEIRPNYLAKVGGIYSSEWFWAKIWHCIKTDQAVTEAAYTWVECADWIPAVITGTSRPEEMKRGICAAGHKGLFHTDWGGYPEVEFLEKLDPSLVEVRKTLPDFAYTVKDTAGELTAEWADKIGLPSGIPVAVGAFDAHLGGIGSGIRPGTLVKNIGTSTCDMMVASESRKPPDIPGLCGIVPGSILPGYHGMEAGQSAVGDIFNWFASEVEPAGQTHATLDAAAEEILPGSSGLVALDWHNGNRTILVDQRLTGLIVGLNLHSTPAEIHRALVEATAFGARVIMERFEDFGVNVKRVVNCGGIAAKSPLVMQIYADVMNRTMQISQSSQTAALGSAIAGSVVAGQNRGGYTGFDDAIEHMTGVLDLSYEPNPENVAVYDRLYIIYRKLHDAFGTKTYEESLYAVMKELLSIRDEMRGA